MKITLTQAHAHHDLAFILVQLERAEIDCKVTVVDPRLSNEFNGDKWFKVQFWIQGPDSVCERYARVLLLASEDSRRGVQVDGWVLDQLDALSSRFYQPLRAKKPKVLTDEMQALLKAVIAEDNQRNGGDASEFRPCVASLLAASAA